MKIKDEILEPYEIWQDAYNFSVGIPYINKNGDVNLTNASYFTSLSNALINVAKFKMADKDVVVNLKEYIEQYEVIKNDILNTIKV